MYSGVGYRLDEIRVDFGTVVYPINQRLNLQERLSLAGQKLTRLFLRTAKDLLLRN